jgi:hypothetical protein
MVAALRAGFAYFLLVFAIGLLLGTARILLLEPQLGAITAVLIELPIILAGAWLGCRALTRHTAVPPTAGAALAMGLFAFALLMAAEYALAMWTPGRLTGEYLAQYREPAPLLGLLGQILFAAFPLIQISRTARSTRQARS